MRRLAALAAVRFLFSLRPRVHIQMPMGASIPACQSGHPNIVAIPDYHPTKNSARRREIVSGKTRQRWMRMPRSTFKPNINSNSCIGSVFSGLAKTTPDT